MNNFNNTNNTNKIEEAIEEITKLSGYCKILKNPDEFFKHMQGHATELSLSLSAFSLSELNETIIEILEKRIPKKFKTYDYGKAYCPTCGTDIHGISKISFCFHCGQKLEW